MDNMSEGTITKVMTADERTKLGAIEALADVTDTTNVAAAGAVMATTLNANTLLGATVDNTPVAFAVAASRIVGRKAAGNIDDLSAAEVLTLINVEAGATGSPLTTKGDLYVRDGTSDARLGIDSAPDNYVLTTDSGETTGMKWAATKLLADTTVNFVATDTSAEIQALIDAQPKDLGGYALTFQYADGTYTVATTMTYSGFKNGTLNIFGNTGEATSLHTDQAVILDSTATSQTVVFVDNCHCNVDVRFLNVSMDNTVAYSGIYINNTSFAAVRWNYVLGENTTSGNGIRFDTGSSGRIDANYVSNLLSGIFVYMSSHVASIGNDDTGTQPAYGLNAQYGSVIAKSGTQPAGSTGAETTANGGVIR